MSKLKRVVIVDYGMGNVGSVKNALTFLGHEAVISSSPEDLERATHLIIPGVGAFADGMKNLAEVEILPTLESEVLTKRKPTLGLCLGMQLLASEGEEGGLHKGLGWIKGRVQRFRVDEKLYPALECPAVLPQGHRRVVSSCRGVQCPAVNPTLAYKSGVKGGVYKVPHIGWNDVVPQERATLFRGVKRPIFYFVHSYHLVPEDKNIIAAETEYGERFVAAIEKDNIFGLQFHPEKSQQEGLRVLENFLNL